MAGTERRTRREQGQDASFPEVHIFPRVHHGRHRPRARGRAHLIRVVPHDHRDMRNAALLKVANVPMEQGLPLEFQQGLWRSFGVSSGQAPAGSRRKYHSLRIVR